MNFPLPADISSLSDESAVRVLENAGQRYLELCGVAVPQMAAVTETLFEIETPESVVALKKATAADAGPLARQALAAMVGSSDRRAARIAQAAVDETRGAQGQEAITLLVIGGGYLLALAVASKVSHEDKWVVHPGFPGLSEVLDKAAKLVSAAIGGGDEGSTS